MTIGNNETVLALSTLSHTWLIDIDGTIAKHNGYKTDGFDTILPGVKDFFQTIPAEDTIIILTSRKEDCQVQTESFLRQNSIRFNYIIYGLPYGERILINDNKPSGLPMAKCVNLRRDTGMDCKVVVDGTL